MGRRVWGRRLVKEGRRVWGGGLGEGDGFGVEMGLGRLLRCAVYEVLLPLMMMITAHRQTHTQTHRHTQTKTVYPPVSLRSLGGYNNPSGRFL